MPRPRKPTTDEIQAAAERFAVTPRTIRRWLDSGLAVTDLENLEAVADFLLRMHAPATAPLETINSHLP